MVYIARDRPTAAADWREGLIETADRIGAFPEIGRTVPGLGIAELREVLHADSRVIYFLAPSGPVIMAVWHARRNLTKRMLRHGSGRRVHTEDEGTPPWCDGLGTGEG